MKDEQTQPAAAETPTAQEGPTGLDRLFAEPEAVAEDAPAEGESEASEEPTGEAGATDETEDGEAPDEDAATEDAEEDEEGEGDAEDDEASDDEDKKEAKTDKNRARRKQRKKKLVDKLNEREAEISKLKGQEQEWANMIESTFESQERLEVRVEALAEENKQLRELAVQNGLLDEKDRELMDFRAKELEKTRAQELADARQKQTSTQQLEAQAQTLAGMVRAVAGATGVDPQALASVYVYRQDQNETLEQCAARMRPQPAEGTAVVSEQNQNTRSVRPAPKVRPPSNTPTRSYPATFDGLLQEADDRF